MIPASYLNFWKFEGGNPPDVGNLMGFTYTLDDNTCEANWEIVK